MKANGNNIQLLEITIGLIILILTFSTFYLAIKIYMNLHKYKEAALGLIFTNIDGSIWHLRSTLLLF
jgi:hypothetical protein